MRAKLLVAACLLTAGFVGLSPSAALPAAAEKLVGPADALAHGFHWRYDGWERNLDGDRVDDLIPAVAAGGLAALPRMADGFLPFLAHDSPAGPLLDVHVAFSRAPTSADVAALKSLGASAVHLDTMLPSAWAVAVTPQQAIRIADLDGVAMVELEQQLRTFNNYARRATQVEQTTTYANDVWNDLGYTGAGVGVAILDVGVDDNHLFLQNKFVAGADTASSCGNAAVNLNPDDDNQVSVVLVGVGVSVFHGTHVAGTAIGRGTATGDYAGMAKDAELFDVKVMLGAGLSCLNSVRTGLSWVDAFNTGQTLWANANFPGHAATVGKRIDVVSMSLGGACSDGSDGLSQTVDWLTGKGVVSVIATGNDGVQPGSGAGCIASPSAAATAVSVGANEHKNTVSRSDDTVATFSNCGPSVASPTSNQKKPDVTAPGVNIQSAAGSILVNGQAGVASTHALSGTSMATPVVAGIVALVLEKSPSTTPAQVKTLLRNNADYKSTGNGYTIGSDYQSCWGFGEVNAYDTVSAA